MYTGSRVLKSTNQSHTLQSTVYTYISQDMGLEDDSMEMDDEEDDESINGIFCNNKVFI